MTGRFDQLLRSAAPNDNGYKHREAFCLMWYACSCGHRERYWNSRDGVTPFCTLCPSCGKPDMKHVDWGLDACAPDHKPTIGQRMWVSMTLERARAIAERRLGAFVAAGRLPEGLTPARMESLVASIYQEGEAPALAVFGYVENSAP